MNINYLDFRREKKSKIKKAIIISLIIIIAFSSGIFTSFFMLRESKGEAVKKEYFLEEDKIVSYEEFESEDTTIRWESE